MVTAVSGESLPVAWDVFNPACPTRELLDRIADKWSMLIIILLTDGPCRFGMLRRRINGISQKMLTQTLRGLERDGLVERRVYATMPPQVEYLLTPLGATLIAPMAVIRAWAETHIETVLAAREAFDARPPMRTARTAEA